MTMPTIIGLTLLVNIITYLLAYYMGSRDGYDNGYLNGAIDVTRGDLIVKIYGEDDNDR